ncbi:PIR Superfamily Protein [Plasmodium ovale curtisi]|uniref:PIR Superfamily Protein n=1 Tax=Plasmodium ovale curtisi TaxID=864141 RepID=A0A1A8WDG4_PLAOA|nr:PIR Superfamily Protein [Plasmodium ovale curtisi]
MGRKGTTLNELHYYKTFYKIQEKFNNVLEHQYDKFLCKDDQVLRYIAMYLLENYKGQYNIICTASSDCEERCKQLNAWLNEKKALYTSNGKCSHHNVLWEQYIEELWKQLQHDTKDEEKCTRVVINNDFPTKWLIPSCNNSNPVKIETTCPETPLPKESLCPGTTAPKSSSCKAVLTTTYVVFGILLFAMYFLRFSSVGMKLNNLIRGKKIKKRNMRKENNECFRSPDNSDMESLDRRFNVIYNSLQN